MNKKISTIFFGTGDFAATILQGLINSPLISVDLVITQPDKPVGRKQELQESQVKQLAKEHNLSIDQPTSLKFYELRTKNSELGIVAQYGEILPKRILDLPTHGILNVHTSLLPKYRGASPIQSALIHGETETGVTIMKMDAGLDTGPILLQKKVSIAPNDVYLTLDKKLAYLGVDALLEAIPTYIDGKLIPTPQDEAKATVCKTLSRDDGRIDWGKSAEDIYNQYRGMTPWPGIWTIWNGKRLKLLNIKPIKKDVPPGTVRIEGDTLSIGCGKEAVEALELQLEGKKPMDAKIFINGYKNIQGVQLGFPT